MRCCKNRLDLLATVLALALWACSSAASAEAITVVRAESHLTDQGLVLSANFDIKLSAPVEAALMSGVTLHFVSELTVSRSRWYWFDTDVTQDEQVSRLSYNALTRQFRLARGALFQSFYDLDSALRVLGYQVATAVPVEELEKRGGGFFSRLMKRGSDCCTASAQMRLDLSSLPKPLQVNALTNDDWKMESGQHNWEIDPEVLQKGSEP